MKILMIGWEFPPLFAGGVGIVCYELTKAISELNEDVEITYIMPIGPRNFKDKKNEHVNLIIADNYFEDKKHNVKINIKTIDTLFQAYMTPDEYKKEYHENLSYEEEDLDEKGNKKLYGKNLYKEVERYAYKVAEIVKGEHFDLIHAHDWMTLPAGIAAKEILNVPLIAHAHNTVYDRYLGKGGDYERNIELTGYNSADVVISISNYVKKSLVEKFGVSDKKIKVIYNGGITDLEHSFEEYNIEQKDEKIVLYAGRAVLQKGPEFFVRAAEKVVKYEPSAKFVLAGDGHLLDELKDLANELGVSNNIYFHGFYNRKEADEFFGMADIFVMPSISEPFGIVPLEAVAKGTPTIISKQSGISEVLNNCFKVDFWDIDEMADKIISLLKYEPLHNLMRQNAYNEMEKFHWSIPSKQVIELYKECIYNYRNSIK